MKRNRLERAIANTVTRSWSKTTSKITQFATIKVDGRWRVFKAVITKTRIEPVEDDS